MSDKKRSLFFVTYQYPYLPGEYFIESEILHLANAFEQVWVFPDRSLWWKSDTPPREMPDGVRLCDVRETPTWIRLGWLIEGAIKAIPFMLKEGTVWPGDVRSAQASLFKRLKGSFKVMATAAAARWFLRCKVKEEMAVAYAYWRLEAAGALALLKRQGMLSQLYVRCHRCDIYKPERYPFEGIIHQEANGIFPVSDDGRGYLINEKGLDASNLEVKRLGVTLPEKCSSASMDGIWRIVSCSNIIPVKRVDLIAKVIGELGHACEWTHIGDGPLLDDVTAITKGYPVDVSVHFTGRISNAEVIELYQNEPVDLFINLSESEGVPVSIMEALAHGIPVVATDVGGSSEIIDSENGRIVDVDESISNVAAAVVSVIEDKDNCLKARGAARRMAEKRCSAESNYRAFADMMLEGVS